MPTITEGNLTFDFPEGWNVAKFDEWSFYRNQFRYLCGGSKGMDILALDPASGCLWQIEVKDYRLHRRVKAGGVAEEVVQKARDTLAALAAARTNASDDGEKAMADAALRCRRLRLVLHLEQPSTPSRLSRRDLIRWTFSNDSGSSPSQLIPTRWFTRSTECPGARGPSANPRNAPSPNTDGAGLALRRCECKQEEIPDIVRRALRMQTRDTRVRARSFDSLVEPTASSPLPFLPSHPDTP